VTTLVTASAQTEEHEQFRAQARRWLADQTVEVSDDFATRMVNLRDWQRKLYAAGYMGISWPAEYGGGGLSLDHQLIFYEELAAAGLPTPVGLVGLEVIGPTILRMGTEEQRRHLIPRLLSGEDVWCQGFSEPGAGSDLASLSTRAVRGGDNYVITGQKVWTSYAQIADVCAVLVRTDPDAARPHQGITCLLVDMTTPGITVRPIQQLTGDREFSEVFFDEVVVPPDRLLGAVNHGWAVAMNIFSNERALYLLRRQSEMSVTVSGALAHFASETAAGRFRPDPHDYALLGEARIAARVMEAQARATANRMREQVQPSAIDSIDKLVLTRSEQAVFTALRSLTRTTQEGRDNRDFDERLMRGYLYSRASTIYGGAAQIQKNIVADRWLGLGRSHRGKAS
jgi:alkylation response protein AidB-like acyl-CoA dehydrogenase